MTPATTPPPIVRGRRARWIELRDLLAKIENLVLHNSQIDALSALSGKKVAEIAEFEADLDRVKADVQREIKQLTVDRLRADLQEKKDSDEKSRRTRLTV